MNFPARVFTVLVCVSLTMPAFSGEAQWVEIHSPHFSVVTDAGERRGRDVALRFEQMRAVFGSLMARAKVSTPIPLQIIAFRNTKELMQFSPLFQGKPSKFAGLFQPGSDRCFILLDMSLENPWQVVFHEYAHQLMNGTLDRELDPWFEEGFAEYFRSITVDGHEADIGKVPEDEYYVLQQSSWMRITDLLRVRQNTSTYNEGGDHQTVFYAESGMLVHYLYDNSLIVKAGDYFNLVENKHLSVEDAIQQAFGMTAPQFDKALRNYASSGRFKYYKLPAPAGMDAKSYASAPLSTTNAQAILADVHLHSADYRDAAMQEFEAVLKADPNNPAALRGLGYSYLIKQDYAKAGEYFHKSAELNPNDARVLYYSAMLSEREGFSSDPEHVSSMQGQLEKSIKLDPDFADAYNILSYTYVSQGKLDEAMQSLRKAIELNPREEQYRFNLANLYMERHQWNDAGGVLRALQSREDAATAARASNELANLQRRAEQGRYERPGPGGAVSGQALINRTPSAESEPNPEPVSAVVMGAAKFLHGKILGVDCSNPPAAVLSIASGSQRLKMHVANSSKTILIGADQLSCDWKNQAVAVNYRENKDGTAEIISLEIQ
jgi:tetratricopeptide (TPR) repeat protein